MHRRPAQTGKLAADIPRHRIDRAQNDEAPGDFPGASLETLEYYVHQGACYKLAGIGPQVARFNFLDLHQLDAAIVGTTFRRRVAAGGLGIAKSLRFQPARIDLIVVDQGSSDSRGALLTQCPIRVFGSDVIGMALDPQA